MLVLVVAALVVVVAVAAGVATRSGTQQQLYDSIKIENLMTHLQVHASKCIIGCLCVRKLYSIRMFVCMIIMPIVCYQKALTAYHVR